MASRLNSVSSNRTKPSVKKVHKDPIDDLSQKSLHEQGTANLINQTVTSSKLLSAARPGASRNNPQLEKI